MSASYVADANARGALLDVRDLAVHHPVHGGFFARASSVVHAVDGISFEVAPRETLALVGESGSGKSSAARAILRLGVASGGRALYRPASGAPPVDLLSIPERVLRPLRRELQIVFQDPLGSLNPRRRAIDVVGEVIHVHGLARGSAVADRVRALFADVGLQPDLLTRHPHELSGGERQRLALARVLAVEPRLIVCDEAVSALDVSIQAQILNLLQDLQESRGIAYLFIAHDLAVVRHLAHRIAVMRAGRIVETGSTEEVFENAQHPYTRALLAAQPRIGR